MPKVFISSTSEDLKEYREAARDAALAARFEPVMMEYFAASGGPPLAECLEKVPPCDVVVAIVAHRYGWVPPDQRAGEWKSITWLECDRAHGLGKEILAFVVDKDAQWPPELEESYRIAAAVKKRAGTPALLAEVARNEEQLEAFQRWLDDGRTRATFISPSDLRAKVLQSLYEWKARHPGNGEAAPPPPAPGDPSRYLAWLREETATIDIRGLGVGSGKAHSFPIEDLCIPLTTAAPPAPEKAARRRKRKRPAAGFRASERRSVELHEILAHPRVVIVGDPGSGKTTFLHRIAYALCQEPGRRGDLLKHLADRPLPVWIPVAALAQHLRNCTGHPPAAAPATEEDPGWLAHYLHARSEALKWGLDGGFFERKLDDGSAILLLDGLDEAPGRLERERLSRLFERVTQAYRRCRIVVTTRPQAYEGLTVLKDFSEARIEPLEPPAIETFLEHWCRGLYPTSPRQAETLQGELRGALRARAEIRRMARNPVMLTALAVVHWNERRLPEQRAELYDTILKWLARSREAKPGRESAERCLALLQELALAMQNDPTGRQVRVSTGWAADKLAPEFSEAPDRGRFQKALDFLEREQADSGIIVSRGGETQFWHLTFLEYLAACAIAGRGEKDQGGLLLGQEQIFRAEWREVALLLAGTLHGKQGKAKVDGLVSAILDRLGKKPTLAQKARCAGLLGAMERDLRPFAYEPRDHRYEALLDAVLSIFDPAESEAVDFKDRLEAAEALGQAGDPRLNQHNWVRLRAETYPISEAPVRRVKLETFEIGKYPVTVDEYQCFVEDEGYRTERWWTAGGFGQWTELGSWEDQQERPNRPVVSVSWFEAMAYCAWKGVRLPAADEWEAAARGKEGREYPWGKEPPDASRANYGLKVGHPTPVGLYPRGATPEGVHDMAGNVWEWLAADGEIRGGAWGNDGGGLRAAYRVRSEPGYRNDRLGFRCARE